MSPEAYSEPGETSPSAFASPPAFLTAESTIQRTTPPVTVSCLVPMERYAPMGQVSERMPNSLTAMTHENAQQHQPPRQLLAEDAADDRGHQPGLRRGRLSLPMPEFHCTLNLARRGRVRIILLFGQSGDSRAFSNVFALW